MGTGLAAACALCLMLGTAASRVERLQEPVELSASPKQSVARGLRRVHHIPRLGETMAAKVNPDCVGPALPNCQHGIIDQDACACKCPWNWKGKLCETCHAGACKNGGTMDPAECACTCQEGYHGQDCGQGSKCLNGGVETAGTCKCKNAFKGGTCKVCELSCVNGGTLDAANCVCGCPANRATPDCAKCQDPGCVNGGIYQDKKDEETGKDLCGCKCKEDHAYTGMKCDQCTDPGCGNGGTFNQGECKCECKGKWQGGKCDTCKLHCANGKKRDEATCTCVDGANGPQYNPCKVGCMHGTLDPEKCTCKCDPGFKGIFCDDCEIEKCFNSGELQHQKDCKCKCKAPWKGEQCEACPLDCGAHGKVKDGCAGCECDASASGKWTGAKCDKCEHPLCENGGTLDEGKCQCVCPQGYSGPTCASCHLTQDWCKHGSALVAEDCKCDCSKGEAAAGDWGGQLCDKCEHQGCKNGGVVDSATCRCGCVPNWLGRYCEACGHQFCEASATGTDAKGSNGVTDKPAQPNCNWIRSSLGCPGPLT